MEKQYLYGDESDKKLIVQLTSSHVREEKPKCKIIEGGGYFATHSAEKFLGIGRGH